MYSCVQVKTQSCVNGGDCDMENSGRCAWKGGSSEGLAICFLVIYVRTCYYMLHNT